VYLWFKAILSQPIQALSAWRLKETLTPTITINNGAADLACCLPSQWPFQLDSDSQPQQYSTGLSSPSTLLQVIGRAVTLG
jgi:hypothetical protein